MRKPRRASTAASASMKTPELFARLSESPPISPTAQPGLCSLPPNTANTSRVTPTRPSCLLSELRVALQHVLQAQHPDKRQPPSGFPIDEGVAEPCPEEVTAAQNISVITIADVRHQMQVAPMTNGSKKVR